MSDRDPGKRRDASRVAPNDVWHPATGPRETAAFDRAPAPGDVPGFGAVGRPGIAPERLVALAHQIYKARRLRADFLNNSLLGEPVWDMLLALFCHSPGAEPLSISGLCYSADVPVTTALRGVKILEQKKLIVRTPDLSDGRRAHVTLSDRGYALMSVYLATIIERGLEPRTP